MVINQPDLVHLIINCYKNKLVSREAAQCAASLETCEYEKNIFRDIS